MIQKRKYVVLSSEAHYGLKELSLFTGKKIGELADMAVKRFIDARKKRD